MLVQNHERVQKFCFYPFRKKLKENPGTKGQFLKTLHKQTRALNSSFSREKSTYAEQYLA